MKVPNLGRGLARRLDALDAHLPMLRKSLRGIERECLRTTEEGALARSPHAAALGSALTHELITTDYSESLLEFITPPRTSSSAALLALDEIHRFVYSKIGSELLWSSSMPCDLPSEGEIPIAEYGSSKVGRLKHAYRKGLALRYGRTMQCIAGIHYNFSAPEALWALLRQAGGGTGVAHDYQSAAYMALVRNFRRYGWLLLYLFGASPALDAKFLRGRPRQLERFDAETLYLPFATSLRMSDLGYQSAAQASIAPDFNSLEGYVDALRKAVETPYPPYVKIGTHIDGEWSQLNTNLLQLENEYYSSIRPKRVPRPGERPLEALSARGVQYVEVRCLDVNPFLPLGVDSAQLKFLDAFLLFCALEDSAGLYEEEYREGVANFLSVAKEGRRDDLSLQRLGRSIGLQAWADELLTRIGPIASLLDRAHDGQEHSEALAAQRAKVQDPCLTPSALVLAAMAESGVGFRDFSLRQAARHADYFLGRPLVAAQQQAFESLARESLMEQSRLERLDAMGFESLVEGQQTAA